MVPEFRPMSEWILSANSGLLKQTMRVSKNYQRESKWLFFFLCGPEINWDKLRALSMV